MSSTTTHAAMRQYEPREQQKEQNDQVRQRENQSQRDTDSIALGRRLGNLDVSRVRLVAKGGYLSTNRAM